jgi:cytochrome c biogenesis protein CcmG, thiol:disulfide interchange protein DsbE
MTPSRARPATRRTMSRTPSRPNPSRAARSRNGRPSARVLLAIVAVAVVGALAIALMVGGDDGGSDTTDTAQQAAAVTVDGQALPPLPDRGDDPAVGASMPVLRGTDLDGRPMTIAPDGRPKMIVFLAHWCPHCQAEVPVVQDWVDGGGLPAGVDLVSVATANDPRRPNFPAADWLDREGWTAPVLLDDADGHAADAAGLTAFPYFVFVDGDGNVVGRTSGELTPAQLDDAAARLERTVS